MQEKLLTDEFLFPYKDKEVPFGPLGYVAYKRTYARNIESENRKEEWWETCKRVIEGNIQLEIDHRIDNDIPIDYKALCLEAQAMYDSMFHLKWLPGGRGIWVSGTEVAKRHGASLTNCYYVDVKPRNGKVSYPFCFLMDMSMLGAGVGFGVGKELINQIPKVANPVDIYVVCSEQHRDYQFIDADKIPYGISHQYIVVKDSREGWVYALRKTIDSFFLSKRGNKKSLVIDISEVRPTGEPIKGFGGKASGPAPLAEMLRDIASILNRCVGRHLSSVELVDVMTSIGRCVVAGNVRRTALIAIGDGGDRHFLNMKNPITDEFEGVLEKHGFCPYDGDAVDYHNMRIGRNRWSSNNSILVDEGFDVKELSESVWIKGEPGFLNLDLVQNYGRLCDGIKKGVDGKATGTNPCGEISLESGESCNLAEIFPTKCENQEEISAAAVHALRYAKRVTLSKYNWEETNEVIGRNRRIGISISGIQDWFLSICQKNNINGEFAKRCFADILDLLYRKLLTKDRQFSQQLNINTSIKLTTVKPSGTISLLAGCSQGIHFPYAEYYIRRMQFQEDDPMLDYLKSLGFRMNKAAQTPKATVVWFPIKAASAGLPGFRSAGEVSAKEQLEWQHFIQTYWSDNQVSCTVSFQESDREELVDLIKEYSQKLKSTSFLPYTPALKEHYPDLPYEPITKEQYEEMMSEIKEWPSRIDQGDLGFEIDIDECSGGACPVK